MYTEGTTCAARRAARITVMLALCAFALLPAACAPNRSAPPSPRQITPAPPAPAQADPRDNYLRPANPWYRRGSAGQGQEPQIPHDKRSTYRHEAANPVNVALLAPLSGQYATTGQQMLQAAQLALFKFNDARVNLMPYDTQGDAYQAVKAFRQAQQQGTDIILGPVFSAAAQAIARPAAAARIPVIAFSNNASLADEGVYVFGMLPETQYQTLTDFAIAQNLRTFSLLGPNNAYGATALKATKAALKNAGRSLANISLYRTDAGITHQHMAKHVRAATAPLLKQENKAHAALVLPETSKRIASIISQLDNVVGFKDSTQLLGDAAWVQNADLITTEALEGAWIAMPDQTSMRSFEQDFIASYRASPADLSALAYDAVSLIVTLTRTHDAEEIRDDMLTSSAGFKGVHGMYRFTPNKLVQRNLAVYRLDRTGNLILLAPAAQYF